MRRLHLLEIADQSWCPDWLRDAGTDYLATLFSFLGMADVVAPRLIDALRHSGSRRIVDLCSGAGGPLPGLLRHLDEAFDEKIEMVLTDLHPNHAAMERLAERSMGDIRIFEQPVDARDVPESLVGLRTIFDGFHHFRPPMARAILTDAVDAREAIVIFDVAQRSPWMLLAMIPFPLLVAILTPWIRPFRWWRLVLTYLLPVIPLAIAWDGFASHCRGYRLEEIRRMIEEGGLESEEYSWELDRIRCGPATLTCVVGMPRTVGGGS